MRIQGSFVSLINGVLGLTPASEFVDHPPGFQTMPYNIFRHSRTSTVQSLRPTFAHEKAAQKLTRQAILDN
jgi:hypothetical protein